MNKITEYELPTESFDVFVLVDKYKNGTFKDFREVIEYINCYFFEVQKGMYLKYDALNCTFVEYDWLELKKEVLNKVECNKTIEKSLETNPIIYNQISSIKKPRLFQEGNKFYINMCFGFLHKKYKLFDEYDEQIKINVYKMINFMREVSCCEKDDILDALLKYYRQIALGEKTEAILYKKSIQGIGKSTESDFFMKYVFGEKICLTSTTEPLLTNYNKIYMGKILIIFEELTTFTDGQWNAVSSRLKTFATEKTCVFRDVYEKAIQADNISNFIINTNSDAIKDSDGRRYIILPMSSKHFEDHMYFDDLKKSCFNMKVGEAFFSYLMTKIDSTGFYAQRHFPLTDKKKNEIAKNLHPVYKFLKYHYVLQNKEIGKIKGTDLYKFYKGYCVTQGCKFLSKISDFYDRIREIGIDHYKSNGYNTYNISLQELNSISQKHKWISDDDDDIRNNDEDDYEKNDVGIITSKFIESNKKAFEKEKQLMKEIDELKNKLKELEKILNNKITKIIDDVEQDKKNISEIKEVVQDKDEYKEEYEEEVKDVEVKKKNYKISKKIGWSNSPAYQKSLKTTVTEEDPFDIGNWSEM